MHRFLRMLLSVTVCAAIIFAIPLNTNAENIAAAEQGIRFAAYCNDTNDVKTAVIAGADYISYSSQLDLKTVDGLVSGNADIIIDAQDTDEAEIKYQEAVSLGPTSRIYFRVKGSAGSVIEWAESKPEPPLLIGSYTGNIYFSALSCINKFSKYENCNTVQLLTGNQDGVILHDTVTFMFEKKTTSGMFSFVNPEKRAKRADSARSWDDLIARGYDVIETSYPTDFAEYRIQNTAQREKLTQSVNTALSVNTQGCPPNRIKTFDAALEQATLLLKDQSSAEYAMADARAALDEAVANINIEDGSKVQGDFEITLPRVLWALFGIALVLSWQIFFRSRWAKTKKD